MALKRLARGGQDIFRFLLALYYQLDHLVRELMKFGTVGAFAYVIDTGLYNILRATVLEDKTITAKVISVSAATLFAFFGNRHWTFRHRPDPGIARGFGVFALLNGVGLVITVIPLWISHYLLGMTSLLADNISTNIIGTGLATTFRFWSYRKWVFLAPPVQIAPVPVAPPVPSVQPAAIVLPPQPNAPDAAVLTPESRPLRRR
ncbi:MAG: GtrA family protein [Sporichthyaceae bacterium]|nr:GtrA family protein [Sporichthyaceae bacterium]